MMTAMLPSHKAMPLEMFAQMSHGKLPIGISLLVWVEYVHWIEGLLDGSEVSHDSGRIHLM